MTVTTLLVDRRPVKTKNMSNLTAPLSVVKWQRPVVWCNLYESLL